MHELSKPFAKILTILLSAAVAVSFASCSSSGNTSSVASTAESSIVSEHPSETSSEASSEASSEESAEASSEESSASIEIGEGETAFTFEVVLDDGTTTCYNVHTDETTVGAALLGVSLIEGEDSEYGLYVKTVDGVTKDYDADGQYWAFYVDGEYASTGVDSTDIVPGSTYTFKVE